ncbi:MAG: polyphosphate kinase 2 family protein [Acidimicrobiales bacterium]|nr:polyphosphate kinase 2 family protein [Acidimicrobiales bacterium]
MKLHRQVIEELRVDPGEPAALGRRSTNETSTNWLGSTGKSHPRELAEHDLEGFRGDLTSTQELLYASDRYAVLIILQALDAAGKDGTIKHVMSGVNPQGCTVVSFKQPSTEELGHDFLWRCSKALPERGRIGIFNRSYYEDVLVTRVHPDLLVDQHLRSQARHGKKLWVQRYEDINTFEHHLHRSGTRILKLFLHVSKDEQKRRFLRRLDDPAKQWKFSSADLAERSHFDKYQRAYEDAITATSTRWAPWYVVPADHKYAARALVGCILVQAVEQLDLQLPEITVEGHAALDAARRILLGE